MSVAALLRVVTEALDGSHIPYMLVGSLALEAEWAATGNWG